MTDKSQYAAVSNIPLIKSPSLRVPRPVELPQDIHPLPDSVTPYFVYPFTLEPHIITLESSRRTTIAAHAARREAYLSSRVEELERRRRDALHRIAPGLGTVLVPTRASPSTSAHVQGTSTPGYGSTGGPGSVQVQSPGEQDKERNVMDDLVNQLAALESRTTSRGESSRS
ncbi:hypothetical protein P691DRAFT_776426 [Macrolepiota fuliginosa MF-IS2]|uniref:Uncharacterized protein n=1 Tax=Macrolepiota fuliginosa MF-IS2 TaxID=1400762 RepID=A0A9P5XC08_9AGAR|nr:hypothetical protein P691DRAFT_776426 [Macrolepiota fuliginosa MF-IS2]